MHCWLAVVGRAGLDISAKNHLMVLLPLMCIIMMCASRAWLASEKGARVVADKFAAKLITECSMKLLAASSEYMVAMWETAGEFACARIAVLLTPPCLAEQIAVQCDGTCFFICAACVYS